jgi:AcrR family transcriptional regulator
MANASPAALKPRKSPVQARSSATVVAIFEATIQVLLSVGHDRLTTTRVAERAGVSVGTLYQYFPHKQALMAAVLARYLDAVTGTVEEACQAQHGHKLQEMVAALCNSFIDAKTRRRDVSLALYQPASELGGEALVRAASQRAVLAVSAMLATASDARFDDLLTVSVMLVSATIGPVQAVMDMGASPELVASLRRHLVEMGLGYLMRVQLPACTTLAKAGKARPRQASSTSRPGRA